MGKKTKIDWCDSTWNPVTGCLHGCDYCYARRIAERFGGLTPDSKLHELSELNRCTDGSPDCYPWGFAPTFHRYKLDEPARWTKPRNIFVVSMGDLFGDWVPNEWIREVFDVCIDIPRHRYLFLTKNPERYMQYEDAHPLMTPDRENFWYGTSVTSENDSDRICALLNWQAYNGANTFVSIEPILDRLSMNIKERIALTKWVIIGAETGNQKNKVAPKREWVQEIADVCAEYRTPIYMKESLRGIMGDDIRQEFPWEV